MNTLIRIENSSGVGIFRFKHFLRVHYLNYFEKHKKFNTPHQENLDICLNNFEWFCGYKSIQDFIYWLNREDLIILINKFDFKIYEISATDIQVGSQQYLFTKESIISKKDITDYIMDLDWKKYNKENLKIYKI